MQTGDYTFTIHLDASPQDTERRVRDALSEQGFGILSEIDVQAALRDKLDEDIGYYTILGACAPPLAHQAIQTDADIGALLPCNVVVRAGSDGGTDVLAADPETLLELSGQSEQLRDIAGDAKQRLEHALDTLS